MNDYFYSYILQPSEWSRACVLISTCPCFFHIMFFSHLLPKSTIIYWNSTYILSAKRYKHILVRKKVVFSVCLTITYPWIKSITGILHAIRYTLDIHNHLSGYPNYLSICLSIYLSIFLYIYHISIYLSIYIYLQNIYSKYLSMYLSPQYTSNG